MTKLKLVTELECVMADHPQLHLGGYGPHSPAERAALLEPTGIATIAAAGVWVALNLSTSVQINAVATVGRLRSMCERDIGGPIPDGALIAAMLATGFLFVAGRFNVSLRSFDAVIERQRPQQRQPLDRLAYGV